MSGSLHVATIAGIRININYTWLIVLVLLTFSLATGWFPFAAPGLSAGAYYLLGFIAAILLFVSVLLHELAHSIVARARGLPVSSISLFIFGGVSNIEQEPRSPGVEFQMAIVGPVTSLILGGISWLLAQAVGGASRPVTAVLLYLAVANVLLGLFNLIPGFPLDGGRVLRSIIWRASGSLRTATHWAARVGQVVAFLFIIWGVIQVFTGNLVGGIWIGFIGWFLLQAAQSANTQVMLESLLRGVTVRDVMRPIAAAVPPGLTLSQMVNSYMLPLGLRAVPVTHDDQLAGLVTLADVRHVPREEWDQTPVGRVMIPLERLHAIGPNQSLNDVLPLMAHQDVNQLPVLAADGRLLGMVTREAIVHFLEVRRGLGVDEAERRAGARLPGAPVPPAAPPHATGAPS